MPPRFSVAKFSKKGGAGASGAAAKAPKPAVPLPSTPVELEAVLAALLAPNTDAITAATKVMTAFTKNANAVPALMQQIAQSANPQARQMAAVILRQSIVKLWKGVKPADQQQVKTVLMSRLVDEPERLVRHSIGALISTLAASLVPKGQWSDLLDQLLVLCRHPSEEHRANAMMLFSALAENLTNTLKKHFKQLFEIFASGLSDASVKVRKEALLALATLVEMLDEDELESVAAFASAVEPVLALMSAHAQNDEMLGAGFEVLECLAESPTQVLDPFLPKITEFMCGIVANPEAAPFIRHKAGFLVTDIIKHKAPKLLRPTNLVPALLQVTFRLVCEPFDEDDEGWEEVTPQLLGIEMLDAILTNLHIAKKDVFPALMTTIGQLLESAEADQRKGAFVIMAIMSQGCSNLVVDHLDLLVNVACKAIVPPANPAEITATASIKVRMHACIAIEQFADYLHPDISAYHQLILPHLLQVLNNPAESDMVRSRACAALDVFCHHLDAEIGKYIAALVPALIPAVNDPLAHVSRSAILAIKAVAVAAKELFEPYLNGCMQAVGVYLTKEDEESLRQRCCAIECVGAMGQAVGAERFSRAISAEPGQNFYDISFHLVVQAFKHDYFELREASYLYFAEMVETYKEAFAPRLPVVMPLALSSLFTDDGITFYKSNKSGFNQAAGGHGMNDEDDDDDDDDEDDVGTDSEDDDGNDDQRRHQFHISTSALGEKIAALNVITTCLPLVRTEAMTVYIRNAEAAAQQKGANDIFTAVWELDEYPYPDVRAANVQCMRELAMWFHRASPPSRQWTQGDIVPLADAVKSMVHELVAMIIARMENDDDRQVAAEACDALGEILQKFGLVVLQQTTKVEVKQGKGRKSREVEFADVPLPEHLLQLLVRFLQEKAPSQLPDEDEDEGEAAEIADHDFVLMESVSDLINVLAEVMGAAFEPGFRIMFPLMERFLRPEKQAATKAMAIGTFAEVVHWLTPGVIPAAGINGQQVSLMTQPTATTHPLLEGYFGKFLQYAQASLQDPSPLVRRNGAFCAGNLLLIQHPAVLAAYPTFLQLLQAVYQPTSGPVDAQAGIMHGKLRDDEFLGARDNACSAIAKMMITSPQSTGVPMSQLIDIVLQALPLECDFNEARYVYPALMNLYRTHAADITPKTATVVSIFSRVFGNPDVDTFVQKDMIAFCKELVRQAPAELERVFAGMPADQQTQFKKFILDPLPAK